MNILVVGRPTERAVTVTDTEQYDEEYTYLVDQIIDDETVQVEKTGVRTVTREIEREVIETVRVPVIEALDSEAAAAFDASRVSVDVVPSSVTMKQARKALILGGISVASVDAAISAIVDDQERELAETDWQHSVHVLRESSLVASMSAALGLSDEQVDDLFIAAAQVGE